MKFQGILPKTLKGMALTASPFGKRPKGTKGLGPGVRPSPWLGFLRYGIYPGASPTVCFAAPPLDAFDFVERSLRSHPRINPSTQPSDVARGSRSRAGELTLGLLSGEERGVVGFGFVGISKFEFDSVFHVGVTRPNTSVSPLSLWERVRVRGS